MEEQPRRKKVDISNQVTGRLQDDYMVLFAGEREIGRMSLGGAEPRYEFKQDFGMEQNKVFQIQTVGAEDEQYVEGCDMGWC